MKDVKKIKEKKISVLVPVYNTEKYLEKSLESILNQTYHTIEIVVVSDASKGNAKEIINKFQKDIQLGKYPGKTIKYIEHDKNKGLYHARLTGYHNATGEYIGIVDSDDYISLDFYRILFNRAVGTDSDIVFGETIFEFEWQNSRRVVHPVANNLNFETLHEKEGIDFLLKQEGQNFLYHVVWNKLYSRRVWDEAIPFLEQQTCHLVMTEDVLFSNVLWFFAKTITKTKNVYYFYNKNGLSATSGDNMSYDKIFKNLSDINLVFCFIDNFFKKVGYSSLELEQHIDSWKQFIAETWNNLIRTKATSVTRKNDLLNFLSKEIGYDNTKDKIKTNFFQTRVDFDFRFEDIKKAIISQSCECVSFDLFDTLVWRPFYDPTDLFKLLDPYFKSLISGVSVSKFSDFRVEAEKSARDFSNRGEITLDEIYEQLQKKLNLSNEIINKLKEKEIEYETNYCFRRDSAFELFELAKYLGKKVFVTSDMYLPKSVIEKILLKNGYSGYTKLYLSSDHFKSKYRGSLYEHFLKEHNLSSKKVVHIGDNLYSDYHIPKNKGIVSFYFPRAIDIFMNREKETPTNSLGSIFEKRLPFWQDLNVGLKYLGVRSFLSLVANKYFDNPFRSFEKSSDFNSDPVLLGYYALGMYNFSQLMWLHKNVLKEGYNNIIFVARDGYLLKQSWDVIFGSDERIKTHYLSTSRRAIVPLIMYNFFDAHALKRFINIYIHSPLEIVEYFKEIFKDDISAEKVLKRNKIPLNKPIVSNNQYDLFVKVLYEEIISSQKVKKLRSSFKETYKDMFSGKTCVYDVGYSGKPEAIFSDIFQEPVDTFFTHTTSDEGNFYVNLNQGSLSTFYNFSPAHTGTLREILTSELGPSCVGYIVQGEKLLPKFEENTISYFQKNSIEIIQKQAIQFVKDIFSIYSDDIKSLYYTDYYLSVPFEMFMQSAKEVDKNIFRGMTFEDYISQKKVYMDLVGDLWNNLSLIKNQRQVEDIENFSLGIKISKQNLFVKSIYYFLFDKQRFVLAIANRLRSYPYLYNQAKQFYFLLKKLKIKK